MADKVALITAAGSGMGAANARKLANLDYKVAILSSSGRGAEFAVELGGVGVTGSNQNTADFKRFVDTAMESFGRINVVINSAGHGPKGRLLDISDDDWRWISIFSTWSELSDWSLRSWNRSAVARSSTFPRLRRLRHLAHFARASLRLRSYFPMSTPLQISE